MSQRIDSIALYIDKDCTLRTANNMLDTMFDGKNPVSILEPEITPKGYCFTVQFYAKDRHLIKRLIDSIGFGIDYEAMADWEVEP